MAQSDSLGNQSIRQSRASEASTETDVPSAWGKERGKGGGKEGGKEDSGQFKDAGLNCPPFPDDHAPISRFLSEQLRKQYL